MEQELTLYAKFTVLLVSCGKLQYSAGCPLICTAQNTPPQIQS